MRLVGLLLVAASMSASDVWGETRLDYSGEFDPEFGFVKSNVAYLPPWPLAPWTFAPAPDTIGREWGHVELTPAYYDGSASYGLSLGLYSNENTANVGRRGMAPIDSANLQLTRIKPQTPLDFDHLALFYDGAYGRAEAGWGAGVSERTWVGAPHDYGLGGVAGDYPYFLDKPEDVGFDTLSAYGSANTSPRLIYLSPRLSGFQVGVSYQPDTRDADFQFEYGGTQMGVLGREPTATGTYEAETAGFDNVVEAGANYDQRFGDFRLQGSAAGIHGDAIPSPTGAKFNDLNSYQAGVQVGWRGWSVGFGGVGAGVSGITETPGTPKRLTTFSLASGVQYETGPWVAGAGMLYSNDTGDPTFRSDRQMHVYSVGATYKISNSFDIGGEFDRVQTESAVYGDYANYLFLAKLRYMFGNDKASSK